MDLPTLLTLLGAAAALSALAAPAVVRRLGHGRGESETGRAADDAAAPARMRPTGRARHVDDPLLRAMLERGPGTEG